MTLKTVDMRLLDIAEITESQGCLAADVDVGHELMAHGGRRDDGAGHDIMVVVATFEYLIVRLYINKREHHTCERQLHLVAQGGIASEEAEAVGGGTRGHKIERESCLGGVIAVVGVIDESNIDGSHSARLECEAIGQKVPPA